MNFSTSQEKLLLGLVFEFKDKVENKKTDRCKSIEKLCMESN
jgi:hypothetical protein